MPFPCSYCTRPFSKLGNLENHIQTKHKYLQNEQTRLSLTYSQNFPNDVEQQSNVSSATDVEIHSNHIGDENTSQHNEDEEPISMEITPNTLEGPRDVTFIYPDAGRRVNTTLNRSEIEYLKQDPFYPFANGLEYKLARWFIKHESSKTSVNDYFNSGLGLHASSESSFKSCDGLWNKIKEMDTDGIELLKFDRVEVDYLVPNTEPAVCHKRNLVNCVKYLFKQPAYASRLCVAPQRDYDIDGQRIYSKMNTADWWWNEQVSQVSWMPARIR